jgi:hypothetical protein
VFDQAKQFALDAGSNFADNSRSKMELSLGFYRTIGYQGGRIRKEKVLRKREVKMKRRLG